MVAEFRWSACRAATCLALTCCWFHSTTQAQVYAQTTKELVEPVEENLPTDDDEPRVLEPPKMPDPPDAKRLSKEDHVWVDAKRRQVIVDGAISLREGYLEMFACLEGTKEHESIVAVKSKAATVHAALLAVGATPGQTVRYTPEFRPPTGTEIEVEVHWLDEKDPTKWHKARAQDWIIDLKTKKPMTQTWVFAGSGFWVDETTGKKYYMAEAGDFICVSNFTTAMLDVPIESSHENDALSFAANADVIPPMGMPVRLVLTPKLKPDGKPAS